MKIIDTLVPVMALVWGLSLFQFADAQQEAIEPVEYFVSIDGDDANLGTENHPFRSIERAKRAVRKHVSGGIQTSVTVHIATGNYELKEPLVFDNRDSGSREHPIRYAAIPGNNVVISGGRTIKNWHVQADGRWTTKLPDCKTGNWFFRQLTVNDQRAVRARWPNEDGELHLSSVNSEVNKFEFDLALGNNSLAGQNTELVVYQNWSVTRGRVTHSDAKSLTTATPMGWIGHGPATTASPGKTVFLEHALRFLDQPAEWFLDTQSGELCFQPLQGLNPATAVIVAPVLQQIVKIAGTADSPVQNLQFQNIRFEHSGFCLPEIGYNEIQAAHYGTTLTGATHVQPVAIECTYTSGCQFISCRFAHLNSSGIGFGIGCESNVVDRCTIENIGGNGVMIGWRGRGNLQEGKEGKLDADWENPDDAPRNNQISNCVIRQCGADSFGGTGVWIGFSTDTQIVHNLIYDLPYTGISVGYRWNTTETTQSNCRVESNHIHDVMQKLADGGGIYTLGLQPGTVFRKNHIHDVHRSRFAHGGAPNNGFFIDEGSKGFKFESNVVSATSGDPVRFNNCRREWHTWSENYFGNDAASNIKAQSIIKQAGIGPRE